VKNYVVAGNDRLGETEFAGSVRRDSHCSIANRHVAVDALADQIMEVFQVGYRPRLCLLSHIKTQTF